VFGNVWVHKKKKKLEKSLSELDLMQRKDRYLKKRISREKIILET
jgi:hypothetical protein